MPVFNDWTIPRELWEMVRPTLRPGMVTLETGSGLSTLMFDAAECRHTALEHDPRFAAESDSVLLKPLVGDPPWYDWEPARPCELILIDGPPKYAGSRSGVLRVIDRLVTAGTVIVLDDTNRADEDQLAGRLAGRFGLQRIDYRAGSRRRFSILAGDRKILEGDSPIFAARKFGQSPSCFFSILRRPRQ